MNSKNKTILLIFVAFTSIYLINEFGKPTNEDAKTYVIFRYDDYSSKSDFIIEKQIMKIFNKYDSTCTFGIIPFERHDEINEPMPKDSDVLLSKIKSDYLMKYVNNDTIDVALHGYIHHGIEGDREFDGLDISAQYARILKGETALHYTFDMPISLFIPPKGGYDLSTLFALHNQTFSIISAGLTGIYSGEYNLSYIPATCTLDELSETLSYYEESKEQVDRVIVVWFHSYDFNDINSGLYDINTLNETVEYISNNEHVKIISFDDALKLQSFNFNFEGYSFIKNYFSMSKLLKYTQLSNKLNRRSYYDETYSHYLFLKYQVINIISSFMVMISFNSIISKIIDYFKPRILNESNIPVLFVLIYFIFMHYLVTIINHFSYVVLLTDVIMLSLLLSIFEYKIKSYSPPTLNRKLCLVLPPSGMLMPIRTQLAEIYQILSANYHYTISAIIFTKKNTQYSWKGIHIYEIKKNDYINYIRVLIYLFTKEEYSLFQVRNLQIESLIILFLKYICGFKLFYQYTFPLKDSYILRIKKGFIKYTFLKYYSNILFEKLQFWVMNKTDGVIAISVSMKKYLIEQGIIDAPIFDLPDAVNGDLFRYREPYNADLIYIGSLDKLRNMVFILKVFKNITEKIPEIKLYLVGGGNDLVNLKEISHKIGIYSHIIFTDVINYSSVIRYLNKASIAVCPIPPYAIYKLSSPLKLFEYISSGKIVVANSEIPEHVSVLSKLNSGFLSKYEVDDFSNAVLYAINNWERYKKETLYSSKWINQNRTYLLQADLVHSFYSSNY
jgi:glycosyltransferase involved in cell wall biosynthesis